MGDIEQAQVLRPKQLCAVSPETEPVTAQGLYCYPRRRCYDIAKDEVRMPRLAALRKGRSLL